MAQILNFSQPIKHKIHFEKVGDVLLPFDPNDRKIIFEKTKDRMLAEATETRNYYILKFEKRYRQDAMIDLLKTELKERKLVLANKVDLAFFKPTRSMKISNFAKKLLKNLLKLQFNKIPKIKFKIGLIIEETLNEAQVDPSKEYLVKTINWKGLQKTEKHNIYSFLIEGNGFLVKDKEPVEKKIEKEKSVRNISSKNVKSSHVKKTN